MFTVSEFIATTSLARAPVSTEARGEVLVIRNPRPPRLLVPEHAELRPVVELFVHQRARGERHASPSEWPAR